MNILYKYCDQEGIEKILETLELKLPYISDVNDPFECTPFLYCPDDEEAIRAEFLQNLNRIHEKDPTIHIFMDKWEQEIKTRIDNREIQKQLESGLLKVLRDENQKSCLLSVSKTARNSVMWAHYADTHEGAVVGIDFDTFYSAIVHLTFDNIDTKNNHLVDNLLNPEWKIKREQAKSLNKNK